MDLKQIKADRDNGVIISRCTWDAVLDRAIELEEKLRHAVIMSALEPWPCVSGVHSIGAIGKPDGAHESAKKTISDDGVAPDNDDAQFIAAANPAVVLDLITRLDAVAPQSVSVPRDGWLIDRGLIYRLKNGANCDEINVTMVDGSRDDERCNLAATEILEVLAAAPLPQPQADDELAIARKEGERFGWDSCATLSQERLRQLTERAEKAELKAAALPQQGEGSIDSDLPPLPEPRAIRAGLSFPKVWALAYTADQMREYAIGARLARTAAPSEPDFSGLSRYTINHLGKAERDDQYGPWVKLLDARGCPPSHSDDLAVDRFAAAMKSKMATQRTKGYGGWDDPAQCTDESLAAKLMAHTQKGDPVDVANFCMMLHQRHSGDTYIVGGVLKIAALDFARRVASAFVPEAPAPLEGQAIPTDLSKRLRDLASSPVPFASSEITGTLLAAANKIDLYYGGMCNWKAVVEDKDMTITLLRGDLEAALMKRGQS